MYLNWSIKSLSSFRCYNEFRKLGNFLFIIEKSFENLNNLQLWLVDISPPPDQSFDVSPNSLNEMESYIQDLAAISGLPINSKLLLYGQAPAPPMLVRVRGGRRRQRKLIVHSMWLHYSKAWKLFITWIWNLNACNCCIIIQCYITEFKF